MTLSAHEQLTAIALAQDLLINPYKQALVFLSQPFVDDLDVVLVKSNRTNMTAQLCSNTPVFKRLNIGLLHSESDEHSAPVRVNTTYEDRQKRRLKMASTTLRGPYSQRDLHVLMTVLYMHPFFTPSQIGLCDLTQPGDPHHAQKPCHKAQLSIARTHVKRQEDMDWETLRPLLWTRLQTGWATAPHTP